VPPKINEAKIAQGLSLLRLLDNPDFKPFLVELDERIATRKDETRRGRRGVTSDAALLSSLDRYQELSDLREWFDDEIEAGRIENEKRRGPAPEAA
jgi:hypothetical protein